MATNFKHGLIVPDNLQPGEPFFGGPNANKLYIGGFNQTQESKPITGTGGGISSFKDLRTMPVIDFPTGSTVTIFDYEITNPENDISYTTNTSSYNFSNMNHRKIDFVMIGLENKIKYEFYFLPRNNNISTISIIAQGENQIEKLPITVLNNTFFVNESNISPIPIAELLGNNITLAITFIKIDNKFYIRGILYNMGSTNYTNEQINIHFTEQDLGIMNNFVIGGV